MREVKFQVWDAEFQKMFSWEEMLEMKIELGSFFSNEQIIRRQYTGLKDKNGREIYEGDILKCRCRDKKKWHLDTFDPLDETEYFYRNSIIEWWQSHCNLGYRLRDGKGKTFMIQPSSLATMDVEVIGNIYENPELLEVKKLEESSSAERKDF